MKVDKLMEDRLVYISDSIKHIATSENGHIPDKIAGLKTNISLIELEVKKLKQLRDQNAT